MNTDESLERITKFLQRWYPPEVAPFVVKKQVQIIGISEGEMTEKDLNLLLSRIQMVILPSFMSVEKARGEIRRLKRDLGMKF